PWPWPSTRPGARTDSAIPMPESGTWYLVPGYRYRLPSTQYQVLGTADSGVSLGQQSESDRLGERRTLQRPQMLVLVGGVDRRQGIATAGHQDRRSRVEVLEGGDERDRPARTDVDRFVPEGLPEGLPPCFHRVVVHGQRGRLADVLVLEREPGSPRHVGEQVGLQLLQGVTAVLARRDAHAHPCPGDGDELVDGLGDRGSVDGEHRDRRPRPEP